MYVSSNGAENGGEMAQKEAAAKMKNNREKKAKIIENGDYQSVSKRRQTSAKGSMAWCENMAK